MKELMVLRLGFWDMCDISQIPSPIHHHASKAETMGVAA